MLRRLASGVALVAATVVMLAGCTPPEPVETTTAPTPSETADAALMALTREAWDSYQERMSQLGADPDSATIEPILEVASAEFADFLLDNFRAAADRRIHTEGVRRTTQFSLSDSDEAPDSVTANACVDLSEERVVGDEGVEIEQPASPQSQTIEFVGTDDPSRYLVAGVTEFDGADEEDPCA